MSESPAEPTAEQLVEELRKVKVGDLLVSRARCSPRSRTASSRPRLRDLERGPARDRRAAGPPAAAPGGASREHPAGRREPPARLRGRRRLEPRRAARARGRGAARAGHRRSRVHGAARRASALRRPALARGVIRLLPRASRARRDRRRARTPRARAAHAGAARCRRSASAPRRPPRSSAPYYAEAQRRSGIAWQLLAAVNYVESDFGRLREASVAGAQGPMQFMPSTWAALRPRRHPRPAGGDPRRGPLPPRRRRPAATSAAPSTATTPPGPTWTRSGATRAGSGAIRGPFSSSTPGALDRPARRPVLPARLRTVAACAT